MLQAEQQQHQLEHLMKSLQKCSRSALGSLRVGYLAAVCQLNEIKLSGTKLIKREYITALLQWVRLSVIINYGVA